MGVIERLFEKRGERTRKLEVLLGKKPIWDFYPDFESLAQSGSSPKLEALEAYTQDLWRESLRCYVDDSLHASIAVCSFTLETALKHELEARGISYGKLTLGACISTCKKNGILPDNDRDPVTAAAIDVNKARNDIVHANLPRRRPDSILYGEGAEHEVVDLGGIQLIGEFENLAKQTILSTKRVLDYLYPM